MKFHNSVVSSRQWVAMKKKSSNMFKPSTENHQKCHHLLLILVVFKFCNVSGTQYRFQQSQLIPQGLHFRQKFIDALIGLLPFGVESSQKLILVSNIYGGVLRFQKISYFFSSGKSAKLLIYRGNWGITAPGDYVAFFSYPFIFSVCEIFF